MPTSDSSKAACQWIDTNLALFGSDVEKKIKLESAKTEAAWKSVLKNTKAQLFIWRIEKFQVKLWQPELAGQFFSGDSYIVLNVREENERLLYDVHFWIGRNSTQDEYATAAYKTVELDTALDGKAVQHREVQGYESRLFLSYFPQFVVLSGGHESGFKHVKPEAYRSRLLQFSLDESLVRVQEVAANRQSLHSDGVFILDRGLQITQWNGQSASKNLCYRAQQYASELRSQRKGAPVVDATLKEQDASDEHPFYKALTEEFRKSDVTDNELTQFDSSLLLLSDASGKLEFQKVAQGKRVQRDLLTENDVFFVDTPRQLVVYIGANASIDERRNALSYAHSYLRDSDHPFASVAVVGSSNDQKQLDDAFLQV